MPYDILVVGAGPAGLSAALEAARLGARVLTAEKKKNIGQPVQCAEFIPKLLLNELDAVHGSIVQEIKGMKTYFPDGECFESNSPGYMLDRSIFDKKLALRASKEGADISINTLCVSKEDEKIVINKTGKQMKVVPKVIIGADGPKSTVGRWIGRINKDFVVASQYEVPLIVPSEHTEVYFDPEFIGGYGWLFPKGRTANVGVGIKYTPESRNNKSLNDMLKKFANVLERYGKIRNSPISVTGGLIPVGGPLSSVEDNIMLVGDAAGQTHPITGSGIPQAIICGKIAGGVAARAVQEERMDILTEYEKEWRSIFGKELERAQNKRQFLESYWDELDGVIKNCWVAFGKYYE